MWIFFWYLILNIFWYSILYFLRFYLINLLIFYWTYLSNISFGISSGILSSIPNFAEWGPARPKVLPISLVEGRRGSRDSKSLRLRSGEVHSAQIFAGEVWRGPPRLRVGSGDPARSTAIKNRQIKTTVIESWQWRSRDDQYN